MLLQTVMTSLFLGVKEGFRLVDVEILKDVHINQLGVLNLMPKSVEAYDEILLQNEISGHTVAVVPISASVMELLPNDAEAVSSATGFTEFLSYFNIFLLLTILVFAIKIFTNFYRIVRSFTRSVVFEEKIVKWLGRIGRDVLLLGALSTVHTYISYYIATAQLSFKHYDISYIDVIDWDTLLLGVILLMLNEIVALAAGMKKEQELTV
jgi:hypothetical protein